VKISKPIGPAVGKFKNLTPKHEFNEAMNWYKSSSDFIDSEDATFSIANIAHAAYHLGAIRALIPLVM
jgi:hypothetical protein